MEYIMTLKKLVEKIQTTTPQQEFTLIVSRELVCSRENTAEYFLDKAY